MSSERRSSVQVAKILRQNTAPPSIDVADTRRYSIQVAQGLRDNNSVNFAGNAPVIDPAAGPARRLERAQTMSPKGMGAGLGTALGGAAAAPAAPHHLSAVPEDDLSRTLKRAASFRDDLMPEQRLENLMVEVKQAGLPLGVIFGTLAPADRTHVPLGQWVQALRGLNRQAFFPMTEEECAEVAELLFHRPAPEFEGPQYVHCAAFRDWCFGIKHLSWRAEKRRSRANSSALPCTPKQGRSRQVSAFGDDDGRFGLSPKSGGGRSRTTSSGNLDLNAVAGALRRQGVEDEEATPLGDRFYTGNHFFWRSRETLEFEMYSNTEAKVITILSLCRETQKPFPALRLYSNRIPIKKEDIEKRCLEKFGCKIMPALQQTKALEGGPAVMSAKVLSGQDPAYLAALAEQGRRDTVARGELWAEYLTARLQLPTPAQAQAAAAAAAAPGAGAGAHEGGQERGPFLQHRAGDPWATDAPPGGARSLLVHAPRAHPLSLDAARRFRERTSSIEDFRAGVAGLDAERRKLTRQSTRASEMQRELQVVIRTLDALKTPLAAAAAEKNLSPAVRRWHKAYRHVRCELVAEGFRTRLRRMPAYQEYMEKMDAMMPEAVFP